MNVLEIMDKESSSRSEVYVYEEGGHWYAYHHSASSLKKLSGKALTLNGTFTFYGIMLDKVEVDLERLLSMNWSVALCSDNEMMLIKNG